MIVQSCVSIHGFARSCQTSKTRVRAAGNSDRTPRSHAHMTPRSHHRTPRSHVASRQGARSASEMQSCWLDKRARRAEPSLIREYAEYNIYIY